MTEVPEEEIEVLLVVVHPEAETGSPTPVATEACTVDSSMMMPAGTGIGAAEGDVTVTARATGHRAMECAHSEVVGTETEGLGVPPAAAGIGTVGHLKNLRILLQVCLSSGLPWICSPLTLNTCAYKIWSPLLQLLQKGGQNYSLLLELFQPQSMPWLRPYKMPQFLVVVNPERKRWSQHPRRSKNNTGLVF